MTPRSFLRATVRLARRVERTLPENRLRRHKPVVGFGFLVRQRRLAEAIDRLGTKHAYEGRMLLRSMIEIQINYSWIRGGSGHSRALRFLNYDVLERLEIVKEIVAIIPDPTAKDFLTYLTKERAKLRHLFRGKNKHGKLYWAKHWGRVSALPDRLVETLKVEAAQSGQPQADSFLYGLYRWTSSAIHGGPVSLAETVRVGGPKPVARQQPERDPTSQLLAAGMMLLAATDRLTADARWRRPYRKDLASLVKVMLALKKTK